MKQITPGPWNVYGDNTNIFVGNMQSTDPRACDGIRQVCEVKQSDYEMPDYDEAAANAALIAATPKLLAACKTVRSAIIFGNGRKLDWDAILDELRAAIAAAEPQEAQP